MQGLSLLPEFVISIHIICCDGGWLLLWLPCLLFVRSWWSLSVMYNKCMCLHIGSHFPAFWTDADVVQGCHWEAGSRVFPQLLGMWLQATFIGKQKKNITKRNPSCFIHHIVVEILVTSLLWFSFILGLNFVFLCFKLVIIHYHTPKQRKLKCKPKIKLNYNTPISKVSPFLLSRVNEN